MTTIGQYDIVIFMALKELEQIKVGGVYPQHLATYLEQEGQFLDSYVISSGTGNGKVSFTEVAEMVDDEEGLFEGVTLAAKRGLLATMVWIGCENQSLSQQYLSLILGVPTQEAIAAIRKLQDDEMEYMLRTVQRTKMIPDGFILVPAKGKNFLKTSTTF